MKNTTFAALLGALAVAAAAGPARAQLPTITPFSFEVRAGAAVPLGELEDEGGASTGLTVSGSVTYHALPLIGIYAGYTYSRFGADLTLDDIVVDGDYVDTGFDVGVRLGIPTPLIPIDPWIKGGLVFHKLEFQVDDSDIDVESDSGFGFEVGAGLGFGFGPFSLTPGVTFVRYSVDGDGGADDDATVSYVKAEIGVRIRI